MLTVVTSMAKKNSTNSKMRNTTLNLTQTAQCKESNALKLMFGGFLTYVRDSSFKEVCYCCVSIIAVAVAAVAFALLLL